MTRASFKIELETDTYILILDLDDGRSLANDIVSVMARLDASLPNGIGRRRVYFRDVAGQFQEVILSRGVVTDITLCSEGQQRSLSRLVTEKGERFAMPVEIPVF